MYLESGKMVELSDIEQAMLSPHNDHEGVRRFGRETEGALKGKGGRRPNSDPKADHS